MVLIWRCIDNSGICDILIGYCVYEKGCVMDFKYWEVLQKLYPGIILKTLSSFPADDAEDEPTLTRDLIEDPELLEWAAGVILRELEECCGEIPQYSSAPYKMPGGGYKILMIATEFV